MLAWLGLLLTPSTDTTDPEFVGLLLARLNAIEERFSERPKAAESHFALVEELLTNYNPAEHPENRLRWLQPIADRIAFHPQRDEIRKILERYIATGDWGNNSHEVYSAIMFEITKNSWDSDFGDWGQPLGAEGPEANAWFVLKERLWSREQAIAFAISIIEHYPKDEYQCGVVKLITEISRKFPNEERIAEALLAAVSRGAVEVGTVLILVGTFFRNTSVVVPFLRDNLSDLYLGRQAFDALRWHQSYNPTIWQVLVDRFMSLERDKFHTLDSLFYAAPDPTKAAALIQKLAADKDFLDDNFGISSLDYIVSKHSELFGKVVSQDLRLMLQQMQA